MFLVVDDEEEIDFKFEVLEFFFFFGSILSGVVFWGFGLFWGRVVYGKDGIMGELGVIDDEECLWFWVFGGFDMVGID